MFHTHCDLRLNDLSSHGSLQCFVCRITPATTFSEMLTMRSATTEHNTRLNISTSSIRGELSEYKFFYTRVLSPLVPSNWTQQMSVWYWWTYTIRNLFRKLQSQTVGLVQSQLIATGAVSQHFQLGPGCMHRYPHDFPLCLISKKSYQNDLVHNVGH